MSVRLRLGPFGLFALVPDFLTCTWKGSLSLFPRCRMFISSNRLASFPKSSIDFFSLFHLIRSDLFWSGRDKLARYMGIYSPSGPASGVRDRRFCGVWIGRARRRRDDCRRNENLSRKKSLPSCSINFKSSSAGFKGPCGVSRSAWFFSSSGLRKIWSCQKKNGTWPWGEGRSNAGEWKNPCAPLRSETYLL